MMTEATDLPKEFLAYKSEHPEFFPVDSPIEQQLKIWGVIKERNRIKENEREMAVVSKNVDISLDEKARLMESMAIDALSEKDPMQRFYTAFNYSHIGHSQILRGIVYAEVLKSSTTTKGLQPAVTGNRGSGKSHAVKTAVHLIPKDSVYTATLSPKALYYKDPQDKTTFYIDDAIIQDEMTSFLKRKMTQFQEDTVYGVVIDKKWVEKTVGKRMVFVTTSVGMLGDSQLSDRALAIDIKNEKLDDEEFYKFERDRRIKGLPEFPENQEVLLCREMLAHIRRNEFRVVMPSMDFAFYSDRRLMGQLFDLVEASAILHYRNRKTEKDGDTIIVWANDEDLSSALDFDMFRYSDAQADDRLLKSERGFDDKIQKILTSGGWGSHDWTEKELSQMTDTNPSTLKKYLYGMGNTASSFKEGNGLCGKTKWYQVDSKKDNLTESVKNYITISKHEYAGLGRSYAWIVELEP